MKKKKEGRQVGRKEGRKEGKKEGKRNEGLKEIKKCRCKGVKE